MKVLTILLSLLYFSGLAYTITEFRPFQTPILIGALIGICVMVLILKRNLIFSKPVTVLFYLYILSCVIASWINADFQILLASGIQLSIFVTLTNVLPSMVNNVQGLFRVIVVSLLFSHLPVFIIPILLNGIDRVPYQGMLYNPNSLGTAVISLVALSLSLILSELQMKRFKSKIMISSLLLFVTSSTLVILSNSRTAFLTLAALIVLFILLKYLSKESFISLFVWRKSMIKQNLFTTIIITSSIVLIYNTAFLYNNVISKFERNLNAGDVTARRGDIWLQTIAEAQLFGHGRDYFSGSVGTAAHNTFISILGQFGIVPVLIFILFLLYVSYKAIKFSNCSNCNYRYVPIFFIMTFVMLSMGESMMLKSSMFLLFSVIGMSIKYQIEFESNK
ncbi:O-antigen ligase family protein [Salisediminibacterium selenitireducens]|uniref:O-antigen ligase-related domain-containing protein n=1 Tax=Bacillus selenitireducens (strain ATCC 700615 / DSM 15326 / MLS10) TaxID=439292 RepID=D6Y022_BACIE|nr:O-antigen ligase family protein [Salisediminibacterium selenitireducens]ADI00524.1 hypothetical protein Bsel_3042 [[Bacillus] selenitireducens MLS10]